MTHRPENYLTFICNFMKLTGVEAIYVTMHVYSLKPTFGYVMCVLCIFSDAGGSKKMGEIISVWKITSSTLNRSLKVKQSRKYKYVGDLFVPHLRVL